MKSFIQHDQEKLKKATATLKKIASEHGLDVTWYDLTVFILQLHYFIDIGLDDLILKRYLGERESLQAVAICTNILFRLDFYKKIEIIDQLNKDFNLQIPMDKIRVINNLRNALVHNFPQEHRYFKYDGSHITSGKSLEKLLSDLRSILGILEAAYQKIPRQDL